MIAKHSQVREASLALLNPRGNLGTTALDPFILPLPVVSYSVLVACEGEASETLEVLNMAALENFQFEATAVCRFTADAVTFFENYDSDEEEPLLAFDFSVVADIFGRLTSLILTRVSFTKEDCQELFASTPLIKSLRLFVTSRCNSRNPKHPFKFIVYHPKAMNEDFMDLFSDLPAEDNIRSNNFILPRLEDLHLFHPCHINDGKLLKQAKRYNKLIKTRAGLSAKSQSHLLSRSGSDVADQPSFQFTLSFSEEHNMRADIPLVMRELNGTAEKLRHVCIVDVGYKIVDTFEWRPEAQ
ncbi:hypothetical protein CPB83DRAFT_187239 [Crepidotus variabilis]|uniref:Uncharacterized protein n=1 Tax=Crepidotus variabilis TaxID=179855 RepID=A0A9P6EI96_9AGAR|nr:hypothetical protein CPB83DRAFT_187239 [Crepidotus variabilis]